MCPCLLELKFSVTVPEGAVPGARITGAATVDMGDLLNWLLSGAGGAVAVKQSLALSQDAERAIVEGAIARGVVPAPAGSEDVVARLDQIAAALQEAAAVLLQAVRDALAGNAVAAAWVTEPPGRGGLVRRAGPRPAAGDEGARSCRF